MFIYDQRNNIKSLNKKTENDQNLEVNPKKSSNLALNKDDINVKSNVSLPYQGLAYYCMLWGHLHHTVRSSWASALLYYYKIKYIHFLFVYKAKIFPGLNETDILCARFI